MAKRINTKLCVVPHQQGQCRSAFCGKLEPTGRGKPRLPDFSDYGTKAAMTQSILHYRQQFVIVTSFGMDQPFRRKSGLEQARRKEAASGYKPEHLPTLSARNAG
ncbi:hypothetical protein [Sphingomonas sp.]|uniref:hypothetical protein n=1 Tax=Sphingomonas sp. TaxID=28214 RepID=UPI0025CCB3B2|nr:hypothetical protein [Sphingomonas sp.]